ncbi:MAG: transposase family protein [Proteobacteria bacterium]|nr:transposase family protein [Pseudomonadota bacterium]
MDGKHILVTAPYNSGSLYYNYKGTFSLNLMALVDGNYKFIFIDVGQYGSNADGGVFQRSEFGKAFLNRDLDIPQPKAIPGAPEIGLLPHCIVADEAFPLRIDLMRPYPRRKKNENLPEDKAVFNYRLSRARRIVENAFGIMVQCWRILLRRMQLKETTAISVVKACCILHNYLREEAEYQDRSTLQVNDNGDVIVPPVNHIVNVAYLRGYHSARDAIQTRDLFKTYFNSEKGALPWQLDRVRGN